MNKINLPRIILFKPSHPGNMGAVARAMKTMGLSDLVMVSPKKLPDDEAYAIATHAKTLLEEAVIVESLSLALKDITYVYATSANQRDIDLPVYSPKTASEKIIVDRRHGIHQSAILFGPENHGLSNEELTFVHGLIHIPTSKTYHSLNLASAVQIIAYEIQSALLDYTPEEHQLSDQAEIAYFYEHLEEVLIKIGFLDIHQPRQLMSKCRRLFNRAHLEKNELQILRGILKAIDAKTK